MTGSSLATQLAIQTQRTGSAPVVLAWVTASSSSSVTVTFADGSTAAVPKLRGYSSPIAGDVVVVLRSGTHMYVVGALNGGPVPPPTTSDEDPTLPPPPDSATVQSFRPLYTGTYRGGAWIAGTTMYQGARDATTPTARGAAYYGNAPSSLDGAAIDGTVRIRRANVGSNAGQTVYLASLAEKTRPAGAPTVVDQLTGPTLRPGGTATVPLPATWVQALMNGTVGGIGVVVPNNGTTPYLALSGRGNWAASMELTLSYTK